MHKTLSHPSWIFYYALFNSVIVVDSKCWSTPLSFMISEINISLFYFSNIAYKLLYYLIFLYTYYQIRYLFVLFDLATCITSTGDHSLLGFSSASISSFPTVVIFSSAIFVTPSVIDHNIDFFFAVLPYYFTLAPFMNSVPQQSS